MKKRIAVIYPAAFAMDKRLEAVQANIKYLKDKGFDVDEYGRNEFSEHGIVSGMSSLGSATERANLIERLLRDDKTDILCAADGGLSAAKVADELAKRDLPKTNKIFIGYSDNTNISVALSGKGAATCVNGEILASVTDGVSTESKIEPLIKVLQANNPQTEIQLENISGNRKQGIVKGHVFGGYIGGIISSVDTAWEFTGATKNGNPDTILLLEDVKPPQEMREKLEVLAQRGMLRNVTAIVIGKCGHIKTTEENRQGHFDGLGLKNGASEKIDILQAPFNEFGHNRNEPMLTVPQFAESEIDFSRGVMKINQSMPINGIEHGIADRIDSLPQNTATTIRETPLGLHLRTPSLRGKNLVIESPDYDIYPQEILKDITDEEKISTQSAWIFQSLLDLQIKGKLDGVQHITVIPAADSGKAEEIFTEMFKNLEAYGVKDIQWNLPPSPDITNGKMTAASQSKTVQPAL